MELLGSCQKEWRQTKKRIFQQLISSSPTILCGPSCHYPCCLPHYLSPHLEEVRLSGQRSCLQCRRHRFDPWVEKLSWRRRWQTTGGFLLNYMAGYSPWGHKESDTTEHEWNAGGPWDQRVFHKTLGIGGIMQSWVECCREMVFWPFWKPLPWY